MHRRLCEQSETLHKIVSAVKDACSAGDEATSNLALKTAMTTLATALRAAGVAPRTANDADE